MCNNVKMAASKQQEDDSREALRNLIHVNFEGFTSLVMFFDIDNVLFERSSEDDGVSP